MTNPTATAFSKIGALAKLGPSEPWQVALLLPEGYDDYTAPVPSAAALDPVTPLPIRLTLVTRPSSTFDRGVPKLTFSAKDADGVAYPVTIFGDTRQWQQTLKGISEGIFMAKAKPFANRLYLTVTDLVDEAWWNRIRPRYAAAGRPMPPASVRTLVLGHLMDAIPQAVAHIRRALAPLAPLEDLLYDLGADGWTADQILLQSHLPTTLEHANYANCLARRLAALASLVRMRAIAPVACTPLDVSTLPVRISQLPGTPTGCQRKVFDRIAAVYAAGHTSRLLVAGDVGVGKSWCAFLALALAHDANARALLLAPNIVLANQLHTEFASIFPDVPATLVTSEQNQADLSSARILVGTSALLHRDIGPAPVDVLIVDEQHRFGRAQRESRMAAGTRLIEFSATPIPRTQALMRFGAMDFIEMRETSAPKSFTTRLYEGREGAAELMNVLRPLIRSGDPVLVVLPKRGELPGRDLLGGPTASPDEDRHSVHASFRRWDALFPGVVRCLTGEDDDTTKTTVLDEIRSRKARVVLCTSVIETGVNLPNLSHIVVVCPERFGMTALHQLRGRTARRGGEGFCHLLCPNPISDEQRTRLEFFSRCSDGFAIADFDLRDRGAGDLAPDSEAQSGADQTLLFGVPTRIEDLEEVLPVFDLWRPSAASQTGS